VGKVSLAGVLPGQEPPHLPTDGGGEGAQAVGRGMNNEKNLAANLGGCKPRGEH
jgi:hypothetical protein